MMFPELDYAIQPERVSTARGRMGAETFDLVSPSPGKTSLRFPQNFSRPGLVTAWVVLRPKVLELSDEKVAEYFHEIDASEEVRDAWEGLKGRQKWRETYTKCAKTYVALGDASDDSWKDPVGMPLEIVPQGDPTSLKVGEKVTFQLLENGRPLPDLVLGLITQGNEARTFHKTDTEGRATFALERPGRALLFAVRLCRNGDEWQSFFTSLTFRIARARSRTAHYDSPKPE
jgi:hypothetical protein